MIKVSACYFPVAGEAELTFSDGYETLAMTVKVNANEGNKLARIVTPCVYHVAEVLP